MGPCDRCRHAYPGCECEAWQQFKEENFVKDVNMNGFQAECRKTAIYRNNMQSLQERMSYCVLGLTSEAGEVAGKLKKVMRDNNGYLGFQEAHDIRKEVGDVLWYCAMILDELQLTMGGCADTVLQKLAARQSNGTLQGSGDER